LRAAAALAFGLLAGCPRPATPTAPFTPVQSGDWMAWLNLEPDGPPILYVTGEIQLPSPGYQVSLEVASSGPPLELALRIVARPGNWPQVITKVKVRYTDEDTSYDGPRVIVREADGDRIELEVEEAE
jgi:hypothetical protein